MYSMNLLGSLIVTTKLAISFMILIININVDHVRATDIPGRRFVREYKTINVPQSNTCEVETWTARLLQCAADCDQINCAAFAMSVPDDGNRKCALISYIDELPVGLWKVWRPYGMLVQVK